jgi:cobalt-precorrin-5B (C1)-methyltransferase
MDTIPPTTPLRRGWTTGACATAAAKAAFIGMLTGEFPAAVDIALPGGQRPFFAIAQNAHEDGASFAAVIKDAGDDPDVTHQALICARLRKLPAGSGVRFRAGSGVGTVTKPGLQIPPGEPAINPVPRDMMRLAIAETAALYKAPGDIDIEISVPGGELLAQKTLNPRLGILGGISILGTTGIVIPYSCSAWIHSIYRGIDVARAEGITHIAGATGNTSEAAIQKLYSMPESALIDMGDFAGGMLKYVRRHPVARVTIAGGFAKMTKLAQGMLDLHSRAGEVNLHFLAEIAAAEGAPPHIVEHMQQANTAKHALELAQPHAPNLAAAIAAQAWDTAAQTLAGTGIALQIAIFNREGQLLSHTPFQTVN